MIKLHSMRSSVHLTYKEHIWKSVSKVSKVLNVVKGSIEIPIKNPYINWDWDYIEALL